MGKLKYLLEQEKYNRRLPKTQIEHMLADNGFADGTGNGWEREFRAGGRCAVWACCCLDVKLLRLERKGPDMQDCRSDEKDIPGSILKHDDPQWFLDWLDRELEDWL